MEFKEQLFNNSNFDYKYIESNPKKINVMNMFKQIESENGIDYLFQNFSLAITTELLDDNNPMFSTMASDSKSLYQSIMNKHKYYFFGIASFLYITELLKFYKRPLLGITYNSSILKAFIKYYLIPKIFANSMTIIKVRNANNEIYQKYDMNNNEYLREWFINYKK